MTEQATEIKIEDIVENSDVKVKVHEYKKLLVIETVEPTASHPDFIPAGGGSFGCVLANCSEKNLGISKEAFALLKTFKRGRDGLGDIDVFGANDNVVFGWIGGPYAIKEPAHSIGSREFDPNLLVGKYKEIENNAPEGAKAAIDQITTDGE